MKTTAFIILIFISIQLTAQVPTWSENISCIVYSHCTPCHNPDGIAPFSLLEYSDAVPLATLLADATTSGYMPRWQPEERLNSFQGERVLSKQEIWAFQTWALAGAPLGDTAYLLPPPVYGDWQIKSPDFTLKLDDYIIQDRGAGNDDFVCINKDMGITAPTFMTAFELIPGGPVHHSLIAISPDRPDTAQFCFSPISKKVIGGWTPRE
ncbi:MAG: hypothetical protein ACI959_002137 [Limisphaerales bacterium]|jgi:hypothetical protein